jgi:LSD1 subclass zinc finger protein
VQFALPDGAAPILHRIDGGRWTWRPPLQLPARATRVRASGCDALQIELATGGVLRLDAARS